MSLFHSTGEGETRGEERMAKFTMERLKEDCVFGLKKLSAAVFLQLICDRTFLCRQSEDHCRPL